MDFQTILHSILTVVIVVAQIATVYLAARGNRWTWILGIVTGLILCYNFLSDRLYMSLAFQVYSIAASIGGVFIWKKKEEDNKRTICWGNPLWPLLVVVEPGDIHVEIDSISSAHGTPQNDSLQMWKQITEAHNARQFALRKDGRVAEADSLHLAYKRYTRQLAANLREGVLHDFLENLYPLTYQKQMPDGRIVTVNADTHEEMQ